MNLWSALLDLAKRSKCNNYIIYNFELNRAAPHGVLCELYDVYYETRFSIMVSRNQLRFGSRVFLKTIL